MGLGLRVRDIVRSWRLGVASLPANFVVRPFAALALAKIGVMVVVVAIVGLATLMPFSRALGQRAPATGSPIG